MKIVDEHKGCVSGCSRGGTGSSSVAGGRGTVMDSGRQVGLCKTGLWGLQPFSREALLFCILHIGFPCNSQTKQSTVKL